MNESENEYRAQVVMLLPIEEQFGFPLVSAFEAANAILFRTLFDDFVAVRDA